MANFISISRVKAKAGYTPTAISKLKELSVEATDAGAELVHIGTVQTGANAGSILALQFFENMSDIEAVYDAFAVSDHYKGMFATDDMVLTGRALLKLHHRLGSPEESKYLVLTKFESETEMLDEAKAVLDLFMSNGGVAYGYGTFMAGSFVGQRLMGVRYPSMEAIQGAYETVSGNADYQSAVSKVKISFRNIVRLA